MNEEVGTSEASVYFNETTRRNIPEGCHHHTRRPENLECQKKECYEREHVGILYTAANSERTVENETKTCCNNRKETNNVTYAKSVYRIRCSPINSICVLFSGLLFKPRRLKKNALRSDWMSVAGMQGLHKGQLSLRRHTVAATRSIALLY
jgi:hypothetical protein